MVARFTWLIFFVALILRLFELPERAIWTADEEYQATYANTIVQDFHPIWIGVSAGDTGFYLGPYFTYLTAFILKIFESPLALNYFSAVLGALTVVLVFYLGKSLKDRETGVIASILMAFSPLMIYFDQRYWNPSPVPFLTVLLVLSLFHLKKNPWSLALVAFCLGAIWNIHLSLVPLYLPAIWYVFQARKSIRIKTWALSAFIFGGLLLPLAIFDYHKNFSNLLTPYRLLTAESRPRAKDDRLYEFGSAALRFVALDPGHSNDGEVRNSCENISTKVNPVIAYMVSFLILAFLAFALTDKNKKTRVLAHSLLALVLGFLLYPGPVSSYYALGIIPLLFIAIATHLRRAAWMLIIIFIIFSLFTLTQTKSSYGLEVKRELIGQVMAVVEDKPFHLEERGTCHAYAGWRYLFKTYGQTPSTSSADASLGWLYPDEIGEKGEYLVQIGVKDEFEAPASPISIIELGGYTAYITGSRE